MSCTPHEIDEARDRLHHASWSLGEAVWGSTWQIDGRNGENVLLVHGSTQAEAWQCAAEFARSLGLLAPPREKDSF
jgi:hypothetical protein